MKRFRLHLVGAAIMLGAGLLTSGTSFVLGRASVRPVASAATSQAGAMLPVRSTVAGEPVAASFRDAVDRVMPAVVEVSVVDVVKQPAVPFPFFMGPQGEQERRVQGLGSGVIVRHTGNTVYVLTNNHVAGDAEKIQVKLSDGRQFEARLVGKDPRKDLALVSFQTSDARDQVPLATLGDSGNLRAGDWVLAIGNPMGFESTVTAGIVSAVGRQTAGPGSNGFTDYIQTDAAINQGNSGGALVNTEGEVVGINTWIASPSGGSVGLGFAIPINNARKAIDDFVVKGKVDYAWLGVTTGDSPEPLLKALGLRESGALIHGVFDGSPAREAGLQPGDVVTRIAGTRIGGSADLVRTVANMAPGSRQDVTVMRDGKELALSIRLNTRADDDKIATARLWPGFSVVEADGGKVVVAAVDDGGRAASILGQGDVVTKVNGSRVGGLRDFYRALNAQGQGEVLFSLEREGNAIIVGLPR
jgi:Do/DeqQ family serine protease